MTHKEYLEYIEHIHGGLSRKYSSPLGLAGYIQNHVYDSAYGKNGDERYSVIVGYDSVTELYFESPRI